LHPGVVLAQPSLSAVRNEPLHRQSADKANMYLVIMFSKASLWHQIVQSVRYFA